MDERNRFWRTVQPLARFLLERVLRWHVTVLGADNVPATGGAVLAFNHHSYADVVLLTFGPCQHRRRPVRFLAKAELWDRATTRWLVEGIGAVRVHRTASGARASAFRDAVQALRDGQLVAVAPEQSISTSYDLLPFRAGAARMAIEAGVPIVPVVGWGSQRALPKGRDPHPRPGLPVVVAYGEPLWPTVEDDPVSFTDRLRTVLSERLDEVQRAYPAAAPGDDWWLPARLGGSAPPHDEVVAAHEDRFAEDDDRPAPTTTGGGGRPAAPGAVRDEGDTRASA